MPKHETRILFFCCAAHFLTHFYVLTFPALIMPISRDLGLPLSQVVSIGFTMYLLYGVLAVPWGYVSDRWGHKWAMALGVITAGLGMAAAAVLNKPSLMALAFTLIGIGCAAYHPSGMALISQGIARRGRALGINGIWGNAGIAAAPFAAGWLNYAFGWQKSLMVLGAMGVLLGIATFLFSAPVMRGTDKIKLEPLENRTARRLFLVFALGMVFSGFMYRSFTVILPSFLEFRLGSVTMFIKELLVSRFARIEQRAGFDTLIANLVATSIYIIGILGQAIGGRVADRYSLKWAYLCYFCLAAPFAVAMVFLDSALLILAGGLFVFFSLGMQPVENSLVAFLTPARWRSMSYGIKFTLLFGVGSFAVNLVSFTESRYGLGQVMWLVCLFLAFVIVNTSVFLLVARGRKISHESA